MDLVHLHTFLHPLTSSNAPLRRMAQETRQETREMSELKCVYPNGSNIWPLVCHHLACYCTTHHQSLFVEGEGAGVGNFFKESPFYQMFFIICCSLFPSVPSLSFPDILMPRLCCVVLLLGVTVNLANNCCDSSQCPSPASSVFIPDVPCSLCSVYMRTNYCY